MSTSLTVKYENQYPLSCVYEMLQDFIWNFFFWETIYKIRGLGRGWMCRQYVSDRYWNQYDMGSGVGGFAERSAISARRCWAVRTAANTLGQTASQHSSRQLLVFQEQICEWGRDSVGRNRLSTSDWVLVGSYQKLLIEEINAPA